MRTLLPSASSANAIASCDPIESPSGLAWDVSRKRCRRRISSEIRRTAEAAASTDSLIIVGRTDCVIASVGSRGPFRLELLKNPFDPVAVFDRLVVEERQFGNPLQLETLSNLPPQKGCRTPERAGRLALCFVVADRRVVDTRLLQVRRHLDARDGEKPDSRIVNVPGQQRRKLRLNLIADTGRSRTLHHNKGKPLPFPFLNRRCHSLDHKHFDDVADLEVVVSVEADAAFEAGLDLRHVVLEAAERTDLAFVNDDVVAKQARL